MIDKMWLWIVANAVAGSLKLHTEGTRLHVRIPSHAGWENTDGWRVTIRDLGTKQPRG
jgi:hypothetical protein